jgi:hypothetical protein
MSDNPRPKLPSGQKRGVIDEFTLHLKLIMRLLTDRRVNILLKLLPIGSMLYWLLPEWVIGPWFLTPIDDAILIWVGATLFVELSPDAVVQEHRKALTSVVDGEWREVDDGPPELE